MIGALFVYGSLRKDAEHPMHAVLLEHGKPGGATKVRGRLYVIDWYPGLVLDPTAGWVVGELWTDVSDEAWPVLDFYEGCSAEDPAPHEFIRTRATVESDNGPRSAWVYAFGRDVAGLEQVRSGDWLRR